MVTVDIQDGQIPEIILDCGGVECKLRTIIVTASNGGTFAHKFYSVEEDDTSLAFESELHDFKVFVDTVDALQGDLNSLSEADRNLTYGLINHISLAPVSPAVGSPYTDVIVIVVVRAHGREVETEYAAQPVAGLTAASILASILSDSEIKATNIHDDWLNGNY